MEEYHFIYPSQIRYGDIDPQWHVNNARYLTYLDLARIHYWKNLGLWDGESFVDYGLVLADIHISYLRSITLLDSIQVGIRIVSIGNKSLRFDYLIEPTDKTFVFARADSVNVAFDYHQKKSFPIPQTWREKISAFEGKNF